MPAAHRRGRKAWRTTFAAAQATMPAARRRGRKAYPGRGGGGTARTLRCYRRPDHKRLRRARVHLALRCFRDTAGNGASLASPPRSVTLPTNEWAFSANWNSITTFVGNLSFHTPGRLGNAQKIPLVFHILSLLDSPTFIPARAICELPSCQ